MKLKIAAVLGALALVGCATTPPPGATMAGWAKETYSGDEVVKRGPEAYARLKDVFGETRLRGENVVVQMRGQQSMFGDGPASYAYVPPEFRGRIKRGDIVVIQVADRGPHAGSYAVLTDLNPPNCAPANPLAIGSSEIFCDGKRSRLVVNQ